MATLIPTASSCHNLQLPPTEKDDRLNLNVRTGSASTLYNSLVFTYGGLTIGLELNENIKIAELISIYFLKLINSKTKKLDRYLSGELFYLNLIERRWKRVKVEAGKPEPKPRLFHELCAVNNCLYVFGGLVIPDDAELKDGLNFDDISDYSKYLVPANDLWEFDLATSEWTLLHDGKGHESDIIIPQPRFNYKMTVINNLTCVNRKDHFGIFIAGGRDSNSEPIYENALFDLVEKKYVGAEPIYLSATSGNSLRDEKTGLLNIQNTDDDYNLSVSYCDSIIVTFVNELRQNKKIISDNTNTRQSSIASERQSDQVISEESIIVYCPTKSSQENPKNPLISFKIGKSIKHAKVLPIHRKKNSNTQSKNRSPIVPFNLKYPTGGLFGQNIVLTGFLPNDFDISIFIYNLPTGKWSRLNIFCNHDYGSHRFWGGFAWQSHHKVILIGNYITSRTTSSIRYFTSMITVSLPITNILASSELAGDLYHSHLKYEKSGPLSASSEDDLTSEGDQEEITSSSPDVLSEEDDVEIGRQLSTRKIGRRASSISKTSGTTDKIHNSISFSEYVDYAAPKTNFTKIRSVFPPAAITLGRNAFDRFGDVIADFEFISSDGDRIPVSLMILMERWGRFFIDLLAKGYVKAVDKFENDHNSMMAANADDKYSKTSGSGSTSSSSGTSYLFRISNQFSLTGSSKAKNSVSTSGSISSESGSHDNQPSKALSTTSSTDSSISEKQAFHMSIPLASKNHSKDAPQFRLPFQESSDNAKLAVSPSKESSPAPGNDSSAIDPHATPRLNPTDLKEPASSLRKDSVSSFSSSNSLLNSHLQDLPPQLPIPSEPIPAVPAIPLSFRSSSRKNSLDLGSPRASLIHTLTALRNIPTSRSPRGSPFASPRASMSAQGQSNSTLNVPQDISSSPVPNLRPALILSGSSSPTKTLEQTVNNNLEVQVTNDIKPLEQSPYNSNDAISGSDNSLASIDRKIDTCNAMPPNKKMLSYSSMTSIESSPLLGEKEKSLSLSSVIKSHSNSSDEKDGHRPEWSQNQLVENRLYKNGLLNFEGVESGRLQMEPSLIPRKLYMPFPTSTLKAFAEYLYTGQVGNKWTLTPAALDNLSIAKFFRVPLLYDLISEVLFGIIGRKEAHVIKSGNKLRRKYFKLMKATNTPIDVNFKFPLDEYEGFMDTVDDGYLDLVLLKKSSNIRKSSAMSTIGGSVSGRKKKSTTSNLSSISGSDSRRASVNDTEVTEDEELSIHGAEKHEVEVPLNTSEKDETTATEETVVPYDSTDESSDRKLTSNSEEDYEFGLGYLDSHDKSVPGVGPRSKSIFDRNRDPSFNSVFEADEEDNNYHEEKSEEDYQTQKERMLSLTLESLVSPTAPPPSDLTIDLIYEAAALTTDMKLMLRAANARQMSKILNECNAEYGKIIENLTLKLKEQEAARPKVVDRAESLLEKTPAREFQSGKFDLESVHSNADSLQDKDDIRSTISRSQEPSVSRDLDLKHIKSSSSLSSLNSLRKLDKAKPASFRSIGGLTPFKATKADTLDAERRFNKVLRKEEELKRRQEEKQAKKEQKLQAKALRHQSGAGILANLGSHSQRPLLSRCSSRVDNASLNDLNLSVRVSPDPSLVSVSDRSSVVSRNTSSSTQAPQNHQHQHHHHHHHHNFLRHLGQKKKGKEKEKAQTQLPQPLKPEEEEIYADKALARTRTSLSVKSLSSTDTVSTKKKHGLFGKKKPSPSP